MNFRFKLKFQSNNYVQVVIYNSKDVISFVSILAMIWRGLPWKQSNLTIDRYLSMVCNQQLMVYSLMIYQCKFRLVSYFLIKNFRVKVNRKQIVLANFLWFKLNKAKYLMELFLSLILTERFIKSSYHFNH